MAINQRQFALLNAMDITLWCDKSSPTNALPGLNVTTVENDNVQVEAAALEIKRLCKQTFFQDILLCLNATPSDVTALPSTVNQLSIKIKSLSWTFLPEEKITLDNRQLQSPSLAVLRNTPALKKRLWKQLSQLTQEK